MRCYFIIKSSATGFFTIIDEEDATVFESSVLQECLNVKKHLEGSDITNGFEEPALEALIINLIKDSDPSYWEVVPNNRGCCSVAISDSQNVVADNISADTAMNLVRLARELFEARTW